MSQSEYDKLFEHDYDGIREYDNPLPSWWTNLWIASIVFSVVYIMYYHLGTGATVEEKYEVAVVRHLEQQLAGLGEIRADDETIVRLMSDEKMMTAMSGVFRGSCGQCHANDGSGGIGPNLTDDVYMWVERPADIYGTIADGIPGTAMPAWGNRLREPQMILLAAYVASIRGQNLDGEPAYGNITPPPWATFGAPDDGAEGGSEGGDEAPADDGTVSSTASGGVGEGGRG